MASAAAQAGDAADTKGAVTVGDATGVVVVEEGEVEVEIVNKYGWRCL